MSRSPQGSATPPTSIRSLKCIVVGDARFNTITVAARPRHAAPKRRRATLCHLSGSLMPAVEYHPPTRRQIPPAPARKRARGEFMSTNSPATLSVPLGTRVGFCLRQYYFSGHRWTGKRPGARNNDQESENIGNDLRAMREPREVCLGGCGRRVRSGRLAGRSWYGSSARLCLN